MTDLKKVLKQPFQVLCINDADKPEQVSDSEWIKKGETYIVTNLFGDLKTFEQSFVLLDKNPIPYAGFNSKRFRPILMLSSIN